MTLKEFFIEYNIVPGTVISLDKFTKVVNAAKKQFGGGSFVIEADVGAFVMDCFMPHYRFDCENWAELEREWKEFCAR